MTHRAAVLLSAASTPPPRPPGRAPPGTRWARCRSTTASATGTSSRPRAGWPSTSRSRTTGLLPSTSGGSAAPPSRRSWPCPRTVPKWAPMCRSPTCPRATPSSALLTAFAEVTGATDLVIGANVQDYSGYPDCRPEFSGAFADVARLGTRRHRGCGLHGPGATASPVQGGHRPACPGPRPRPRAHAVVLRPAGAVRPLRALRRLPPSSRRVPGGLRSRPLHLRRSSGPTSLAVAGHGRCISLASMGWIAELPRELTPAHGRRATLSVERGRIGLACSGVADLPPVRTSALWPDWNPPGQRYLHVFLRERLGCLPRTTVGPGLLPGRNEATESG